MSCPRPVTPCLALRMTANRACFVDAEIDGSARIAVSADADSSPAGRARVSSAAAVTVRTVSPRPAAKALICAGTSVWIGVTRILLTFALEIWWPAAAARRTIAASDHSFTSRVLSISSARGFLASFMATSNPRPEILSNPSDTGRTLPVSNTRTLIRTHFLELFVQVGAYLRNYIGVST